MLPLVAVILAGLVPLVLTDPLPQNDIVDGGICYVESDVTEIVGEHVVYIDYLFETNVTININGGVIIISNAPTRLISTITSTLTVTTTSVIAQPTNTAVPIVTTEDTAFLLSVNVVPNAKRQVQGQFLTSTAAIKTDCTDGSLFSLSSGILSTQFGVVSSLSSTTNSPFVASQNPSGISTTFGISGNLLVWQNANFFGGQASFCSDPSSNLLAVFNGDVPSDCTLVEVGVFPVAACPDFFSSSSTSASTTASESSSVPISTNPITTTSTTGPSTTRTSTISTTPSSEPTVITSPTTTPGSTSSDTSSSTASVTSSDTSSITSSSTSSDTSTSSGSSTTTTAPGPTCTSSCGDVIIIDESFEDLGTGTPDWTLFGSFAVVEPTTGGDVPRSGNCFVKITDGYDSGAPLGTFGGFYQNFSGDPLCPGLTYEANGWFSLDQLDYTLACALDVSLSGRFIGSYPLDSSVLGTYFYVGLDFVAMDTDQSLEVFLSCDLITGTGGAAIVLFDDWTITPLDCIG